MIDFCQGRVIEITGTRPGVTEIMVETDDGRGRAVNYDDLTGSVAVGDVVMVNTTAVNLRLGTGGYHFVMANLTNTGRTNMRPGHIMKLRYTPCQLKVNAVEEQGSLYYHIMKQADSLEGMPVVLGLLHSMLPYAAAGVKAVNSKLRVVYVMTDGGALPLAFSKLVTRLRESRLLEGTVTVGHAFGGDLEAINIYTGLLAARAVLEADVAVVTMGPGIAGTGTRFGFSGLEQADIINAVANLQGRPFVIPRLSFADSRPRHRGLSHHTRTILQLAHAPATVVFPKLDRRFMADQLEQQAKDIPAKHTVQEVPGTPAHELLQEKGIAVSSMGRGFEEDPAFFLAAGATGILAAKQAARRVDSLL
ncbi:MAG: DUF3866 family protein [Thermoanaerobacteraceae bacterium]|nr:DUF3866 family protein [Thermoanaerobacteraceae bacterium]